MTLEEWKLTRTAMLIAVADMDAALPALKSFMKLLDSRTEFTRKYVDYWNKRAVEGDMPTSLHEVAHKYVVQHEAHYATIRVLLIAVAHTLSIPLPKDDDR